MVIEEMVAEVIIHVLFVASTWSNKWECCVENKDTKNWRRILFEKGNWVFMRKVIEFFMRKVTEFFMA